MKVATYLNPLTSCFLLLSIFDVVVLLLRLRVVFCVSTGEQAAAETPKQTVTTFIIKTHKHTDTHTQMMFSLSP